MPEGPTIVLLKEEVEKFTGKKVINVTGNSKIEQARLLNKKVLSFKSHGKQFLICFQDFTVRVHFLLFGKYLIDETKDQPVRLNITFKNGEINLYSCSVKIIDGDVNTYFDWSTDVMNDTWNPENAKRKLKEIPDALICDALLEQDIFSGVGNIIKNEILYRTRVHPESTVKGIPPEKIQKLIEETRLYSFKFLEWKRNYVLRKHWLAHTKTLCLRCNLPIIKKYTGVKNRRSFFCANCQILYT
jgi:endonuclease VIII